MVEISITNALPFDTGFVVGTNTLITPGNYVLQIESSSGPSMKTYSITHPFRYIVDSWEGIPPTGNVCFTLQEQIPCPVPSCDYTII